jgi:hypothetical protein
MTQAIVLPPDLAELSRDLARWLNDRTENHTEIFPLLIPLAEVTAELLNTTRNPAQARVDWIEMLDEFMAQPNELFARDANEPKTPGV